MKSENCHCQWPGRAGMRHLRSETPHGTADADRQHPKHRTDLSRVWLGPPPGCTVRKHPRDSQRMRPGSGTARRSCRSLIAVRWSLAGSCQLSHRPVDVPLTDQLGAFSGRGSLWQAGDSASTVYRTNKPPMRLTRVNFFLWSLVQELHTPGFGYISQDKQQQWKNRIFNEVTTLCPVFLIEHYNMATNGI